MERQRKPRAHGGGCAPRGTAPSSFLGRIAGRDALFKHLRDLGLGTTTQYGMELAGGRAFYQRLGAGEQLGKLVVREPDGSERVLADPAKLGQGDQLASVNAFAPSPDGKLVAYDVALGGGEVSSMHVMDVAKGIDLPDVIDHVWGESAARWMPDGRSFFYRQMAPSRSDADPLQDMEARYHVLGEPVAKVVPILGHGLSANLAVAAEELPTVAVLGGASWAIAFLGGAHSRDAHSDCTAGEARRRTGAGKTPWREVAEYSDQVERAVVHGDRLYLTTFKGAPNRRLVSVPLSDPDLAKAKVEIAEDHDAIIASISDARDALYVETRTSGRAGLWRMPWNKTPAPIDLPFEGSISELATDRLRDGARFGRRPAGLSPTAFYDACDSRATATPTGDRHENERRLHEHRCRRGHGNEQRRHGGPAVDPAPKGSAGGRLAPDALLYGYGGYGNSQNPTFSTAQLPVARARHDLRRLPRARRR